jgi:hypothetical protein
VTSGVRGRLAWVLGIGAVVIILGVAADSVVSGGIGGDDLLLVTRRRSRQPSTSRFSRR